mmetsp:Transcript_30457/g.30948  ORF Transcript_30457/g.30948 Transcript_30457/m.30948 type:complete len:95 (-) Transcript_30457:76-360(-)
MGRLQSEDSSGGCSSRFRCIEHRSPAISPVLFLWKDYNLPDDAAELLTQKFGADWMTPRRWCSWNDLRLCDTRDELEHEACIQARQEMRDGPFL